MMDLKKGIAVITGGATGIGRCEAESLLKRGAKVVIADISEKACQTAKEELGKQFGSDRVASTVCDVRDINHLEAALKLAKSAFGGLNILVNNAGIMCDPEIDGNNIIAINCKSIVAGTRLALKYMSKQNGGSGGAIINIASIVALYEPWAALPTYCASKSFVLRFTECMGEPLHYDPSGVRIMSVSPGITVTNLDAGLPELFKAAPEMLQANDKRCERLPRQKPDNVGEGVAKVLERAENGTAWLVENGQPPQLVHMKVVKENIFLN